MNASFGARDTNNEHSAVREVENGGNKDDAGG